MPQAWEQAIVTFLQNLFHTMNWAGVVVIMVLESCNIPIPSEVTMPLAGWMLVQALGRGPLYAILVGGLVGALGCTVGSIISYGLGAEMLNFGALIAFMGVNLAAFMRYFVRGDHKKFTNFLPPIAGFLICLLLWLNLSRPAKIVGSIWMIVGIAFGAVKTRGFRGNLIDFDLPPEEA